ncbi:MAG TPA: DUF6797 domain-containing protein, partial [Planctomycetaceae bacterium]|nr:DUF6797 domain-containing protein [Planctomycetaceae bacterium]
SHSGLFVEERPDAVVFRDLERHGEQVALAKTRIDEWSRSRASLMPEGLANQLGTRQQFLDLVRYLLDIAEGGPGRARQLDPPPSLFADRPLPDYEHRVDHAGLIRGFDAQSFERGRAIYERLCVNCHGTHDRAGSLPTSLRFASGPFKNGSDPFSMYQTLTRGFGLMPPQTWMVPQQKYDVIHYIREAYLRPHNRPQLAGVTDSYLAGLPAGDTRGPEPSNIEPWAVMDYGPSLIHTYEIGRDGSNLAYKGIAVRLDGGPGGVSRGGQWMIFDHDTLRVAAVWSGTGFIDWNGIQFNGRHQVHPRAVGDVHLENTGPGWANPDDGRFDDPRLRGRDGNPYGPLPRDWARYRGLYHHGQKAIIEYTVGDTLVLETPGAAGRSTAVVPADGPPAEEPPPVFTRTFNVGPRRRGMVLNVAAGAAGGLTVDPGSKAIVVRLSAGGEGTANRLLAGITPHPDGAEWHVTERGLCLTLAAGEWPLRFTLWTTRLGADEQAATLAESVHIDQPARDLEPLTRGGPPRWPQVLETQPVIGRDDGPFAVDVLTPPADNPWLAQLRLTGFDFFPDGRTAAVCAWDGDVWLVEGVDRPDEGLAWRRIASGLFQPLGLKIVEGAIYVTCRDQIAVLLDLNGDGETDFYENFNNDHQVTEHFHEFAMGLQTDARGNFYYAKSARHALPAVVPHHGTLLRVSRDGARTDILARGFRAANGVCLNADGTFFVTDQEGHWIPKNRINLVRPGGFYGNMFGYHDVTDTSDAAMEQPLCWITNAFDRSPAELLWVEGDAWRPLAGSLLSLSYGYGKIFIVPHERLGTKARSASAGSEAIPSPVVQGGLVALPIPAFPTGIMRGRFHPTNGQLYTCGMFAWAGNATEPGGFYRVRYTGQPLYVPAGVKARRTGTGRTGIQLTFTGELDADTAADASRYAVRIWSLSRTADYGSAHHDERSLPVKAADLSSDGRTVFLELPDLEPTWCMAIAWDVRAADGVRVTGELHNTVHRLGR